MLKKLSNGILILISFFSTFSYFAWIIFIYSIGKLIVAWKSLGLLLNGDMVSAYEKNQFLLDNGNIIMHIIISLSIFIYIYKKRKDIALCKKVFAATFFYNILFGIILFLNPYNLLDFNINDATPNFIEETSLIFDKLENKETSDIVAIGKFHLLTKKYFTENELVIVFLSNLKNENNFYAYILNANEKTNEIKSKESLNEVSELLIPFFGSLLIILTILIFTIFIEFGDNKENFKIYYNKLRYILTFNIFLTYLYYFYLSNLIDKSYENYNYVTTLLNLTVLNFSAITLYYIYYTNKNNIDRLRESKIFEKGYVYIISFILIILIQILPLLKNEFNIYFLGLSSLILKITIETINKIKFDIDHSKNRDIFFHCTFIIILAVQIGINSYLQDEYIINKSTILFVIMFGLFYSELFFNIFEILNKRTKKIIEKW